MKIILPRVKPAVSFATCLAAICLFSLAWVPAKPATPAPVSPSAVPVTPLPTELPASWGNPKKAKKPLPPQTLRPRSYALVDLPTPVSLARMPVGRVHVGMGRVDPQETIRHSAVYVVKAQAPGIVEYLYDQNAATHAGQPLLRLYDLNILSDLRIGESAMAKFATSPFVIAPRLSGLPPLPPRDFPAPTALQRLLGIRPTAPAPTTPEVAAPSPPQSAQLTREGLRAGLSQISGLSSRSAGAAPTPEARSPKAPSVQSITRLSSDMAELNDRLKELEENLSQAADTIKTLQDQLGDAKDDAATRERLYNQGVLARNLYESARNKVAALQDDLNGAIRHRAELVHARDLLQTRIAAVQAQMDEAITTRARAAATLAAHPEPPLIEPRQTDAHPAAPAHRDAVASVTPRAASPARRPADVFPSPTRQPHPELAHLPRVAKSSARLQPQAEIPQVPMELKRLAAPRWVDQSALGDGVVVRQLQPAGAQVQAGTPLLEIANREWARVYSDIKREDVAQFPKGAPVNINFDSYPGVTLEGWINSVDPLPGSDLARVEMIVVATQGYCPDDTYASLEWLALAAPIVTEDRPEAMTPAVDQRTVDEAGYGIIYNIFPLIPPQIGPAQEPIQQPQSNEFVGLLRLGEVGNQMQLASSASPDNSRRLTALRQWRASFTAGMTTGIFGNLALTYPADNEITQAIERMATARVSHDPDRCARTMREALGWGLGDAAVWMTRLPERGYKPRQDGLARPGDILVWPFTYGARRSQHIGVAVSQGGKLMLLSNLSGTLGTSELLGGYVAFYKPTATETPKVQAKTATATKTTGRPLVLRSTR